MKVMRMDEENVVVFLPTPSFSFDIFNKDKLEDYFKELFLKLEERYHVDMNGFYQIEVYQDPYYGSVFEIVEEEIPYFDYFDHQVEMSIHAMKESKFLYQVKDILDLDQDISSHAKFYQYQNQFYIELKEQIPRSSYMKLLEYSELIYGKKAKEIMLLGNCFDFHFCKS